MLKSSLSSLLPSHINQNFDFQTPKYSKNLVKRFGMRSSKPIRTPMSPSSKLDLFEKGKEVDQTSCRGMIGSLLYYIASRPHIMFNVCMCSRFHACPKESHLLIVRRIFRYLNGIQNICLLYLKSDKFDLIGCLDEENVGCNLDRKMSIAQKITSLVA